MGTTRVFVGALVAMSLVCGNGEYTSAESGEASATNAWQQVAPLFPHTPGSRWVYTLSGEWYDKEAELSMEVKGQQYVPRLKLDVVVFEEAHPGVTPTAPKDILPVLYYPYGGYLVRNTNHVYGDDERTTLVSMGTIGESFAPVFPLALIGNNAESGDEPSKDWQKVEVDKWGEMSQLDTQYRFVPEKEPIAVQADEYADCMRAETKIARVSGRGFQYTEWYAPGVGMVKSTTMDLKSGMIVEQKDLIKFQAAETEKKGG